MRNVIPSSDRWTSYAFWAATLLLCLCSIVQLELATAAVRWVWKTISVLPASPPPVLALVFPRWVGMSRWPWELVIVLAYGICAVWGSRRGLVYGMVLQGLLWLLLTTMFFAVIWLAALPFATCCV